MKYRNWPKRITAFFFLLFFNLICIPLALLPATAAVASGYWIFLVFFVFAVPFSTGYLSAGRTRQIIRFFLTTYLAAILSWTIVVIWLAVTDLLFLVKTEILFTRPCLLALMLVGIVAIPAVHVGNEFSRWIQNRSVGLWIIRGASGFCLFLLLFFFSLHMRNLGLLPFVVGSRVEAFDRLLTVLDDYYSHWNSSPIDRATLESRYRPIIERAAQRCLTKHTPCKDYQYTIRAMLSELQDGHTRVIRPHRLDGLARPALWLSWIADEPVITDVLDGSDAADSGLKPGMVISSVEERGTELALNLVPAYATAFTSPVTCNRKKVESLLLGEPGSTVRIEAKSPDGTTIRTQLKRQYGPYWSNKQKTFDSRWLNNSTGYIRIGSLRWSTEMLVWFDRQIDSYISAKGLVLDLRGNSGGNSLLGEAIVGRLISESIIYGKGCNKKPHPYLLWMKGCFPLTAASRKSTYTGPVAVLLDNGIHSSAEQLAAALCDTNRARCFGTTTAGDSGNPLVFYMPDLIKLRFSASTMYRLNGSRLNGYGISPHEVIHLTISDVVSDYDRILDAAINWLRSVSLTNTRESHLVGL